MAERIWKLDFFRGVALILMVMFHFIVLLTDYFHHDIDYTNGFWHFEGRLSAIMFIVISGISSALSKNNLKRGVMIFFFGMAVTLATFLFSPDYFVKFGILHFLGLSIILSTLIKSLSYEVLFVYSISSILFGYVFSQKVIETSYLFPIGLANSHFSSMDYYPIFPWFGVFLLGVILGKQLYKERQLSPRSTPYPQSWGHFVSDGLRASPLRIPALRAKSRACLINKNKAASSPPTAFKPITFLGKHSLLIYLIHQPILYELLYITRI